MTDLTKPEPINEIEIDRVRLNHVAGAMSLIWHPDDA
jgi:hypothetical protein